MVIVNLNKYQILLKTVELGSITRAAEALGYTQSAVSRVIADLEREWDMELLTRSRTGVVLSSSGAALLPYVQAVCNAGRELEEQVAELHGLTRGTLRVATFASVSIHWLPAIMKEFLGRYPGIQFDLVSNWEFAEVEDLLRQGQADCGFLGLPAAFVNFKIHGDYDIGPKNCEMLSEEFMNDLSQVLGIQKERIFVAHDVCPSWGWVDDPDPRAYGPAPV